MSILASGHQALLGNAWQDIREGIENIGGEDPFVKGVALVITGLVALLSLGYSLLGKRARPSERIRINADIPSDQRVRIETRSKDESV